MTVEGTKTGEYVTKEAIAGCDVILTIDANLQAVAEQSLKINIEKVRNGELGERYDAHGGAIVVVNVKSGEILALASAPDYEPGLFYNGITQAKYNEYLTKATKDASADIAQYMCQMLPMTGGAPVGTVEEKTTLAPPYAISYEVGAGLNNNLLAQGGHSSSSTGAGYIEKKNGEYGKGNGQGFTRALSAAVSLGASEGVYWLSGAGDKVSYNIPGGTREMWSTFNRETRICRLCSSTVTKDCNTVQKNVLGRLWQKEETNCTESEPIEKCDDIEM